MTKKSPSVDFNLENEIYDFENDDKYYNIFMKILISLSLPIIIISILATCGISSITLGAIIIAITAPITYITVTKLKNKSEQIFKRDMYESKMLGTYFKEAIAKEHIIDKQTTYFMHDIGSYDFDMDIDELLNINQLLFLINQSYYDVIENYGIDLSRHELVIKILDQIKIYIENNYQDTKITFSFKDIQNIINNCFFIPEDTQKNILEELRRAEVKSHNRTSYVIMPNDESIMKETSEEYFATEEYLFASFDVQNIQSYEMLMKIYKESDKNPYKDAFLVEWDLEAIRDCLSLIVRRFGIIIEKRGNELYHFEMASTFFYNLNAYASLNKVSQVGIKEIINTFKGWNYFDFNLKLDILDAIFEEFNLDYSMHPYRENKKNKDLGKIYHFPKKEENKK
ncbi:MAG: hypothetical protein K2G03_00900 [Bacilli bacterium]|nr:hypothetical protein [Bacilli bacterium]